MSFYLNFDSWIWTGPILENQCCHRRVHAHSPQQRLPRGAQRGPPSWLEGATRDSDPPASNPRHRLALSSQQQTLPQALGRWDSQAGRAHANGANAETVAQQSAAAPGGHQAHQHHNAGLMQRTRNALANRYLIQPKHPAVCILANQCVHLSAFVLLYSFLHFAHMLPSCCTHVCLQSINVHPFARPAGPDRGKETHSGCHLCELMMTCIATCSGRTALTQR